MLGFLRFLVAFLQVRIFFADDQPWMHYIGGSSFLQVKRIPMVGGPLAVLAKGAMGLAMAKQYKKQGIITLFLAGDDYPWVCRCTGFPNTKNDTVSQPGKCPVDHELGCQ